MSVVVTSGLTRTYVDTPALAPLDLAVESGRIVAVVGPNGSGKTTLIRLLAGLLDPTDGTASVCGEPSGSIGARAATSYVPDVPSLYSDLSVLEHAEYVAGMHGVEDWSGRADELLETLALSDRADDLPSTFSRGLRQKTSLLLGFVRPFRVLLMDEPSTGLDAPGVESLVRLTKQAATDGAAVLLSTHRTDVLAETHRCLGLRDGTVAYDGPPTPDLLRELGGDA